MPSYFSRPKARGSNLEWQPPQDGLTTRFSETSRRDRYFGVGDWSGDAQLLVGAREESHVTLELPPRVEGDYRFDLYATRAPDYGIVQVLLDDHPLGEPLDLYAPIVVPTGAVPLGRVHLTPEAHSLTFRVVGWHEESTGRIFGIDCIDLVR